MKGILRACFVVLLQTTGVAHAFESDVHFSTTYVLARALGWTSADALTIASANQSLDENRQTVAAIEVDAVPGPSMKGYVASSPRQAEKNLRFHCFSSTPEQGDRISADVMRVIAGHFAAIPAQADDPGGNARRLIALGTALHCLQDAHSHVGFGGSCGAHRGSCHGHAYQTFLDQLVFGLLGQHRFNPDHPAVSGERLLAAITATTNQLAARRPAVARPIPPRALRDLSDALRGSGLELPDELRIECNRYIVGKWLFDFFVSGSRLRNGGERLQQLAPGVAAICRNGALGGATVVRVPEPRFPRLEGDGSPYRVKADGTYQVIERGDFAVSSPAIHTRAPVPRSPDYSGPGIRLQLSHWSHLLALPRMQQLANLQADARRSVE